MIDIESYRRNAADCVRQAQGEADPGDRNILLNVALAWLRLAQQTAALEAPGGPRDLDQDLDQDLDRDLTQNSAHDDEETFDPFVEERQPAA